MEEKVITFIKYQESVIARGIEKKLREQRFRVHVMDTFDHLDWRELRTESDLFVFYLPARPKEDETLIRDLRKMIADIDKYEKKAILIGDEDDRADLKESVPAIWSHVWMNRPIDIKELLSEVRGLTMDDGEFKVEKHILIVDDDPAYAKMVREWLRSDYRVDIVTDGMQAITFLTRTTVDLILLDYEMPITDGPQVLEMLRQEPEMADIPAVFLTGVDSTEAVKRAAHLRPKGYLLKSTSRGDLMMYLRGLFKSLKK